MRNAFTFTVAALAACVATAHAGEVDPSLPVIVAFAPAVDEQSGNVRLGQTGYVLLSDGTTWKYSDGSSEQDFAPMDWPVDPLPVPLSDVAFWSPRAIVTKSGDMWRAQFLGSTWTNIGHPPLNPVPTEAKSLSDLKGAFGSGQ